MDERLTLRIQEILTGSGLPAARRKEVAEELRTHLEQLVEAGRAGGLEEPGAVESALRHFGEPSRIRRDLRRQSRLAGRWAAWAAMRAWLPALLILAVLPIGCLVPGFWRGLGAAPWALPRAILASLPMYAGLVAALALILYPLLTLRIRLADPLPRSEHRRTTRFVYWFALTLGALIGGEAALAAGCLLGFPVLRPSEELSLFALNWVRGFFPAIAPLFTVAALIAAAAFTWLERRPCPPGPVASGT